MDEPAVTEHSEWNPQEEAKQYHAIGSERQTAGDMEDAAAYYAVSLELFPTAEAHTSLAITLASRGRWEEAITHCKEAIALDPDLGNPYNDMAVYLSELGRNKEALPILDQAIAAPRYDCRHHPYYHRGRILEQMARFTESRDAYRTAIDLAPTWEPARRGYHRVLGWLN